MSIDLQLGATYRDRVSGWTGIATARYEYMNGCIRVEVSHNDKDGKPESFVFDIQQLEYVDAGLTAASEKPTRRTGGPQTNRPVAR